MFCPKVAQLSPVRAWRTVCSFRTQAGNPYAATSERWMGRYSNRLQLLMITDIKPTSAARYTGE